MHRTEGPDFATVSGKRRHKNTFPETVINKDILNACQEELCLVVEKSGQTVNASGAADEAAGWGQVVDAVGEVEANGDLKTLAAKVIGITTDFANFNITYIKHTLRRLITMSIPTTDLTIITPVPTLVVRVGTGVGSGTQLPDYLLSMDPVGKYEQVLVSVFGVGVESCRMYVPPPGIIAMAITRPGGGNFPAGVNTIYFRDLTYFHAEQPF